MTKFVFIIGDKADFESTEALIEAYTKGNLVASNASAFVFEVPENLSPLMALHVGRGMAFSKDWCMDGTFSVLGVQGLGGEVVWQ